jgi:hypothetical protein
VIARRLAEHADDGVSLAVDPDRLAEQLGIAVEALLPEVIAQDGHLIPAWRAFRFEKQASHRERVAEAHHPRKRGRRGQRQHLFRPLAGRQIDHPEGTPEGWIPRLPYLNSSIPTTPQYLAEHRILHEESRKKSRASRVDAGLRSAVLRAEEA